MFQQTAQCSISRAVGEFSLTCVYPTMLEENFQIYGVQITGKCICQSNIYYTPWQITNFPPKEQIFLKICHLSEKGTMMDPNEI